MYINREISGKILQYNNQYPVITVIGPRQSGKTTLLQNLFPNKNYVNLEDIEAREFAINDPKGFLSQYKNGLIIDEVQRVPSLLSYIQVNVDKERKNGKYILSGSQNLLLMENVTQSLAGRSAIFKLMPLSLKELSSANIEGYSLEKLLFNGLYPKLYDQKIDTTGYYSNYIQTYVERDVRLLQHISDLNTFQKFIKMCATRTGQLLNLSSLSEDCGISHNTAKSWISVLEASFIIFLMRPHHKNYNKRLVKMPKIYFYDSGLLCSLLNIENKDQLHTHFLRGNIFESFIISEIVKYRLNNGLEPNCYFWRDKLGKEIDCIIEKADKVIPIEIKSGNTISEDYFKGLKYYNKLSGRNSKESFLIYGGDEVQRRNYGTVLGWKNLHDELENTILN